MNKISATALFRIKPGKLDEFKILIASLVRVTKEQDPGTLVYEVYLNEEKMECVFLESYKDSQSVLAHAGNVGHLLEEAQKIADQSLEVYGDPDEQLKKILDDMGVLSYTYVGGL